MGPLAHPSEEYPGLLGIGSLRLVVAERLVPRRGEGYIKRFLFEGAHNSPPFVRGGAPSSPPHVRHDIKLKSNFGGSDFNKRS